MMVPSTSSKMIGSHMCMSPLGYLGLILVIVLPMVGCFCNEVSVIIVGRRMCRPCVSAFLLVVSTPPLGLGWSIQAGMSCLGGLEFGPCIVLPRY